MTSFFILMVSVIRKKIENGHQWRVLATIAEKKRGEMSRIEGIGDNN
jgi:hypothetical protein